MATLQETLSIDLKYTSPYLILYQLYKGGLLEGWGDASYCLLTIGCHEKGKYKFLKSDFQQKKTLIENYISFIEYSDFDSITREELEFIKSSEYDYLSHYLHNSCVKFNNNFSELYFHHHRDSFTKNDEGKPWWSLDVYLTEKELIPIWNYRTNEKEKVYVGDITIKKDDKNINIPIIRPNFKKVEIVRIETNVNLYKCLGFIGKLNALYNILYEDNYEYPQNVFWNGYFKPYNYNLQKKMSCFNYYNIFP